MRISRWTLQWTAASIGVVLFAFGCEGPTQPAQPSGAPAAIALVSGENQEGKAGERLPHPFVVRVTDERGAGVRNVEISWRVVSGTGDFSAPGGKRSSTVSRPTDADGFARATFRPTAVGMSAVAAEATGLPGSPVTFTTEATVLVVNFGPLFDCGDPTFFSGPDGSSDVTVPVGTPVEWVYAPWLAPSCEARVTSDSEPSSGEPFDSGILNPGYRFRFVPEVAGTWEYSDVIGGGSGTLTAGSETGATATIRGTVTIGELPIIGAMVTAVSRAVDRTVNTGYGEAYIFWGLPPGTYRVEAAASGVACGPRTVTVPADTEVTVNISCTVSLDLPRAGIYVANADGSDPMWLTSGNRPDWSPNGERIAFDRNGHIYVVSPDGSEETSLVPGKDPAWSHDGTRIVFVEGEGISVMDADGSDVSRLIEDDFVSSSSSLGVGRPAWSPDGVKIAFNHLGDGVILPAQIYVIDAHGSEPRRVTDTDGGQYAESDPSWSPDGASLVFWSYSHGIATLTEHQETPSSVYKRFPFVHYGAKPAWSPDGTTILFTARRNGIGAGPFIYSVASSEGHPRLLIPGGYDPAWSPDGARVAFVHGRSDG